MSARADRVQEFTISHTGSVLGDDSVERTTNQTAPSQLQTPVLSFEAPRKFDWIEYNGGKTKFIPRTVVEGVTPDGTTVSIEPRLQPVAGEEDPEEQDFAAAIVVDGDGNVLEIESYDYAANAIELAEAPAGDVTVFPLVTEGTVQFRGVNQFGQVEGLLYEWATPIYRFADYDQQKRGTEVRLHGRMRWSDFEKFQVLIDSPHELVWEHDLFPHAYVSNFEQKVDIRL